VKHDSIILLHKLGAAGREATSVLSAQLKDPDETVRRFSADAMGWTKDPAGVPALVEAMRGDKNGGVRGTAAQALGMIGPDAKSSVPALEAALKDEDIGVRMFSAESLWKVAKDTEKSVPVLVQALYWKNTYDVGVTAGMLGRMGANAKSAVPELLKMLKEGDEIRRKVAADLLKTIDPKAASEAGVK
jgi:HEAT repeat protein